MFSDKYRKTYTFLKNGGILTACDVIHLNLSTQEVDAADVCMFKASLVCRESSGQPGLHGNDRIIHH